MVRVARVVAARRDHDAGRDEARDVVDVAVGVVALDAVAEPDHVARAEELGEHALHRVARAAARRDSGSAGTTRW